MPAVAFEVFVLLVLVTIGVFVYEALIRSNLFKFLRITPPADSPEEVIADLDAAEQSARVAAEAAETEAKKQAAAAETLRERV